MAENKNTPYGESMKIYEIIEVLKETERLHNVHPLISPEKTAYQNVAKAKNLLKNAIEKTADNTEITPHSVEEKMTRYITNTVTGSNLTITDWCYYIIQWLTTSDKTQIKNLLKANTTFQYHEYDLTAINNWQ
ncbi:MAG: hypothetical protein NC177_04955 [Ruminococcus flavefaciens]|nr:hypothetical protein [Ruminococcus flavefaciens]